MASATGIPDRPYDDAEPDGIEQSETEPLLGRPGDAVQDGVSMFRNLVLGTN